MSEPRPAERAEQGPDQPARVLLLGSQRRTPSVAAALEKMGIEGRVGLITAGWQDWEADPALIDPQIVDRVVHLALYAAADRVWREDPELAAGHRAMQTAARTLRRAYNLRLGHALDALAGFSTLNGEPRILDEEAEAALEAVRALDAHHQGRIASIREDYHREFRPGDRAVVQREREELHELTDGLEAIVIEGGHVAVLINRLRLFGVRDMLADKTVIACSGGAMVLGSRLVLFHDSPPQGHGHPEVQESGLALYPDMVALPLARTRLRLDDAPRMAQFAHRFAPSACVPLAPRSWVEWSSGAWTIRGAERIASDGSLVRWESAA